MNGKMKFKKTLIRAILQAISKLNSNEVDVLQLKYFKFLSNEDIASTLQTTEQNVRTIESRAVDKLSNMILGE